MFRLLTRKQGIEKYKKHLGFRYRTMRQALDEFVSIGGRTVVELGTSRSFVPGGFPGCCVNDIRYWRPHEPRFWDWGAGTFTRVCAEQLSKYAPRIYSVDINPEAIEISKVITGDFAHLMVYRLATSESFLSEFEGQIDLLYMDTGEPTVEAAQLHLREARMVVGRNLLSPKGLVLIDDAGAKGSLSIPFFLANGLRTRSAWYQILLQRTSS